MLLTVADNSCPPIPARLGSIVKNPNSRLLLRRERDECTVCPMMWLFLQLPESVVYLLRDRLLREWQYTVNALWWLLRKSTTNYSTPERMKC